MKKLVCAICGMEINDKNYNFNSAAFLNENSMDNIKYCPFCGVKSNFISEQGKMIDIDRNTLDKNAIKIIDHAVKLEIFNGDFYKEASMLAEKPELKKMFKALSVIEYTHARIHKYLAGIFQDPVLSKLDYSKYNDDMLLDTARKREIHAVEYYKRYRNSINSPVIKSIFDALAEVETAHIELTDK